MAKNLRTSIKQSVKASSKASLTGGNVFGTSPLDLRFALQKTLDPRITFTRASTGTYVGSDGLLQTATTNEARFDHNPTTGESLGLLVEEPRTNSLTNNTMVGAVAGTPGTLPTGWPFQSGGGLGLSVSIVGTGTESGVAYLDWRISGTASAATAATISFGRVSALTAQTWTTSSYLKLAAGSLSGVTLMTLDLIEETVASIFVTGSQVSITLPTTNSLITQRPTASRTLTGGATVAQLRTNLTVSVSSGSTVDFTIRIGLPQLEQGAFATSVIATSTATATRAADVASITGSNFSSWYNQTEGTVFADAPGIYSTASVLTFSDGSNSNRILLDHGTNTRRTRFISGGSEQAAFTPGYTYGTQLKTSLSYASNYFSMANAGVLASGAPDTSGLLPVGIDRIFIGSSSTGTGTYANTSIRRLTYWPTRLADTVLQQITQ
jgi:hypothetical protein